MLARSLESYENLDVKVALQLFLSIYFWHRCNNKVLCIWFKACVCVLFVGAGASEASFLEIPALTCTCVVATLFWFLLTLFIRKLRQVSDHIAHIAWKNMLLWCFIFFTFLFEVWQLPHQARIPVNHRGHWRWASRGAVWAAAIWPQPVGVPPGATQIRCISSFCFLGLKKKSIKDVLRLACSALGGVKLDGRERKSIAMVTDTRIFS